MVQSGATAALIDDIDSRKQTTYCLNTVTNIAWIAGVNGEGAEVVWQKREEEGYGTASYPDKEACFQIIWFYQLS